MRRHSPVDDANNGIKRHAALSARKITVKHDAEETVARVAPKSRSGRRRMEQ